MEIDNNNNEIESLNYLVNHICLPLKLPNRTDEPENNDWLLLQHVVESLNLSEIKCFKTDGILSMFKKWSKVQGSGSIYPDIVNKIVLSLKESESIPVYLPNQNAGLIISKYNESNSYAANISFIQPSLSNHEVMSIDTDITCKYPFISIDISNMDVLKSNTFASQLCDLANTESQESMRFSEKAGTKQNEIRNTHDSKLVTKWLLPHLLSNDGRVAHERLSKITKKVRDDVVYNSTLIPFRRSGLWMTIKVALQLRLYELYGEENGKLLYKCFQSEIVELVLTKLKGNSAIESEVKLQIMQKLARRLYKLEKSAADDKIVKKIVKKCHKTILDIKMEIVQEFKEIEDASRAERAVLDFSYITSNDIVHDLDVLERNIKHLLSLFQSKNDQAKINAPPCTDRNWIDCKLSSFSLKLLQLKGEENKAISLYDAECWVLRNINLKEPSSNIDVNDALKLFEFLKVYIDVALNHYKDDPLGNSRMIMICMFIVCRLDQIATKEYPLLLEHNIGFDINPIEWLLLPRSSEILRAVELKDYIENRKSSHYNSLIENQHITCNSFNVRYAKTNADMQRVRKAILDDAEEKKEKKLKEIAEARKKYKAILNAAKLLSCEYYKDIWHCMIHSNGCKKCSLNRKAAQMKVNVYEWPLPKSDVLQNNVVFELRIPSSISYLRDSLHLLKTKIYGNDTLSLSNSFIGTWINYSEISSYSFKTQQYVTFGSVTKLFAECHYKDKHPSFPDSDFLPPNGYSVDFSSFYSTLAYGRETHYQDFCTLKALSPYNVLQFTVKSLKHTENDVIAIQSKCPQDLQQKEFMKFGCLRAGYRLQTRNLLDALETTGLSFKNKSVYSLIAQSLWQVGPLNSHGEHNTNDKFYPASHADYSNVDTMQTLHGVLKRMIDVCSKCWDEYLIMLNIIIIAAEVIAMAPNNEILESFVGLMLECRTITLEWTRIIQNLIQEDKSQNTANAELMQFKLIDVSLITIMTYFVDKQNIDLVMRDSDDCVSWLITMACLHDHTVQLRNSSDVLRRNLFRHVKITMTEIEHRFFEIFYATNGVVLSKFVETHWSDSSQGVINKWQQYDKPAHNWFHADFIRNEDGKSVKLQLNLNGGFLVQGRPVGTLPQNIYTHSLFERFFEKTFFDVKPSSKSSNGYVTEKLLTQNGYQIVYEFELNGAELIVNERWEYDEDGLMENEEYQMLPHNIFNGHFPSLLIINYSHWYKKSSNEVEFRPRTYTDENYNKIVEFRLDLNERLMHNQTDDAYLIDIKSKTFAEIHEKITKRFELQNYVHVYVMADGVIKFELPCFGLNFILDPNRQCVLSKEYHGMKIDENQMIQTLYGLEKGLVLCSDIDEAEYGMIVKRQFIVPNGEIQIEKAVDLNHQNVDINISHTRKPAFYTYDVDCIFKKLRGGPSNTSWLYLAWLHAATSYILPDTFTGLTGTEMSLQILQSACCWSCKPLDDEALFVLGGIKKLSPQRVYYPDHLTVMQTVNWPAGLSCLAAHEGFQFIVENLIKDSEQLSFLFVNSSKQRVGCSNRLLARRAYYRNLGFQTNATRLDKNFEHVFELATKSRGSFELKYDWNVRELNNVRIISMATYSPSYDYDLLSYFRSQFGLDGFNRHVFKDTVVTNWLDMSKEFHNYWIDLYCHSKTISDSERVIELNLLLSLLAYKGVGMNELLFFQFLSSNQFPFQRENPPIYPAYEDINSYKYSSYEITDLLKSNFMILDQYMVLNPIGIVEDYEAYIRRITSAYEEYNESRVCALNASIQLDWPSSRFSSSRFNGYASDFNRLSDLKSSINALFKKWYENRELHLFLNRVKNIYTSLPKKTNVYSTSCVIGQDSENLSVKVCFDSSSNLNKAIRFQLLNNHSSDELVKEILSGEKIQKDALKFCSSSFEMDGNGVIQEFPFEIKTTNCAVRTSYFEDSKNSWNEFLDQKNSKNSPQHLSPAELLCELKVQHIWYLNLSKELFNALNSPLDFDSKIVCVMAISEISPRVTPTIVLKYLTGQIDSNIEVSDEYLDIIRAIAIVWTIEQRLLRCITFTSMGEAMKVNLKKELSNIPYENWSPIEQPEWLVIQLELNLLIRSVQVKVANEMIQPKNNQNTVMQLNMGEGKTTVIIPLLISSLANGKRLVRITVLRSLLNTNYMDLVQKLGGVLNRRVYIFPCHRDMDFKAEDITTFKGLLLDCQRNKGCVVTLPEYRLSFQLKGIEMCLKGDDIQNGMRMVKLQLWLDENIRDILDESDDILSVKYQLVYTIGNSEHYSGGDLRWKVCQAVLSIARGYFAEFKTYTKSIEFNDHQEYPQAYPHVRFLNMQLYSQICEKIVRSLLSSNAKEIRFVELKKSDIEPVIKYVLQQKIGKATRDYVKNIFEVDDNLKTILLILRGLFAYQAFYTVFTKRWRVNYGVNLISKQLLQAVPYKAKDVPAERAQYAHPDIVILSTQLSYFYSGLSNKQMDSVFDALKKYQDASQIYDDWIHTLPSDCVIDSTVREYAGINLSDSNQKLFKLYPLLRFHTVVINFWLNERVYPKEAKQFASKLQTSAWNLCETNGNPTTGFSGTNDSTLLLPLNAVYNEIPELKGTNGGLMYCLSLDENNSYTRLPVNASGKEILGIVSKSSKFIRLLLDVGALMLDLSNEKVIREWLSLVPKEQIEAGVFYDDEHNLVVLDRKNRLNHLHLSPYHGRLDKCIIYLDDIHTRGTDLKFPHGSVGAVTLGKNVTKDRLVQGCMRMRMLGDGHVVQFYASSEAHDQISEHTGDPNVLNILEWCMNNSRDQVVDNFIYWAYQGLSYASKNAIKKEFEEKLKGSNPDDFKEYAEKCIEKDTIDLDKLYNDDRVAIDLNKIVERRIDSFKSHLTSLESLNEHYTKMAGEIGDKCKRYVKNEKRFSHLLEEEQEQELEIEQEEMREQYRPQPAKPLKNRLDDDVKKLVIENVFKKDSSSFVPMMAALKSSSLNAILQENAWSSKLYVTRDYTLTVDSNNEIDDYLRPPRWLCVFYVNGEIHVVVLSDFETNELCPFFDRSKAKLAMLMPRAQMEQETIFPLPCVEIPVDLMSQLFIFSGSMYFKTLEEQQSYVQFIGYSLSPRNTDEQDYYDKDLIHKNGYVPLEHRHLILKSDCISKFKCDPRDLILKLVQIRNYGVVPQSAHHLDIFQSAKKSLKVEKKN